MIRPEYFKELKIREAQLKKELEAIKLLLHDSPGGSFNGSLMEGTTFRLSEPSLFESAGVEVPEKPTKAVRIPSKGEIAWREYIKLILERIGGRAKSTDVSEQIISANTDIHPDTIKMAVKQHLAKMAKDGEIHVKKGASRKEGFVYMIE